MGVMALAIGLAAVTALLWAGVGAGYQRAGAAQVYGVSLGFAVAACALILSLPAAARVPLRQVGPREWLLLLGTVGVSGILRQATMLMMARAMQRGRPSVTWAVVQSAMVCPFLFGVLAWREKPSLWQWLGLAFLLLGLVFAARSRPPPSDGRGEKGPGWVTLTALGFLMVGAAQVREIRTGEHCRGVQSPGTVRKQQR